MSRRIVLLLSMVGALAGGTPTTPIATAATSTATPATVNSQLAQLRPGDTLMLQSGTYGEIARASSGSSWSAPVRIVAAPGATVRVGGIRLEHTRYVSFEGLNIDCRVSTNPGANEGVWLGRGAGYIRVARGAIHHCRQQGVLVTGYSLGHNQFVELDIAYNGSRAHYQHGLYISAADNLIADSHIHHNAGYGVHVYASAQGTANRNIVRNNRIEHNGTMGDTTYGILLQDGAQNAAIGNVLRNNNTGDIQVGDRTSGTVLRGNQTSGKNLIRGPVSETGGSDTETPPAEDPPPPTPALPPLPPRQPSPQPQKPSGLPPLQPVGAIPQTGGIPPIPGALPGT